MIPYVDQERHPNSSDPFKFKYLAKKRICMHQQYSVASHSFWNKYDRDENNSQHDQFIDGR
jgi:hypothetical protein